MEEDFTFVRCTGGNHGMECVGSIYPKDRVPEHLFRKDPKNSNSKLYKQCWDCRNYQRKGRLKLKNAVNKQKSEVLYQQRKYLHCQSNSHNVSGSPYNKTEVPIEKFINKESKDTFYNYCEDCRNYKSLTLKEWRSKTVMSIESDLFFCLACNNKKPINEMYVKKNGQMSKNCLKCKDLKKKWSKNGTDAQKANYKTILYNRIKEDQSCCVRCKCIFLTPLNNTIIVRKYETYLKEDGLRYFNYEMKEYSVMFLIENYKESIELSAIQLDHMTEFELREKEILKEDEIYIPKINSVSAIRSIKTQNLESMKTQHLCLKCHLEVTIEREKGTYKIKNPLKLCKFEYVNGIKLGGCISCGYKNENLLRFFDMDHLDPKIKVSTVSQMVQNKNYTLQDVILECYKCRVLCKFCHSIHTSIQRKSGMFETH